MTKRRVVLLVTIVVIVAGLVGVVYWYTHRYGDVKQLVRADVAMRAGKFDKAAAAAREHMASHPDDWRGYQMCGRALSGAGRYKDAREVLTEAIGRFPERFALSLLLARTYSVPARQAMTANAGATNIAATEKVLAQCDEAQKVLLMAAERILGPQAEAILSGKQGEIPTAKFGDVDDGLAVLEEMGLNQLRTSMTHRWLGGLLVKRIEVALLARQDDVRIKKIDERLRTAWSKEAVAQEAAAWQLLAVATADASRDATVRAVVGLCTRPGNGDLLAALRDLPAEIVEKFTDLLERLTALRIEMKARLADRHNEIITRLRKVILAAKDPAPVGSTNLVTWDIEEFGRKIDTGEIDVQDGTMEARQDETARFLEGILSRHPQVTETLLARARLALRSQDLDTARFHFEKLQAIRSDDPRVRLLGALLLKTAGNLDEARKELRMVTGRFPGFMQGHLDYARLLRSIGGAREGAAMTAMRHVVKQSPGNAEALAFLAETLLANGLNEAALEDASAYYKAHPDDPTAVSLLVVALVRTDQRGRAQEVLKTVAATFSTAPELAIAAVSGYMLLGQAEDAKALAEKIAKIAPTSPVARIAVARAMFRIGRMGDAQRLLAKDSLTRPGAAFHLGTMHAAHGHVLDSLKQFRRAVKLRPYRMAYRLRLARAHLDNGDLQACEDILKGLSLQNREADRLRLKVALRRGGDDVETGRILTRLEEKDISFLPLAALYLRKGRLDKCIEACKNEIEKNRNLSETRFLLARAYAMKGERDQSIHHLRQIIKIAPNRLPAYRILALVLAGREKPEQVAHELSRTAGAREGLVNLTMGWLLSRTGKNKQAAEWYGRVAGASGASQYYKSLAKVLRAQALARVGQTAPALAALDELAVEDNWAGTALLYKASILAGAGRKDEAAEALAKAAKQAVDDADQALLRRIVSRYTRMGRIDDALSLCQSMRSIAPLDSRPCAWTAETYRVARRWDKAVHWYRQALKLDPDRFGAHVDLARALDVAGQPSAAIAQLKGLEALGETAKVVSLFEQGEMFARWGLHAQAANRFEQSDSAGGGDNPGVRLALGRAFARLGKRDQARTLLSQVPQYSRQFAPAQFLLADLADDGAERLKILTALAAKERGGGTVPLRQMSTMLQMGQAERALEVFQSASGKLDESSVPSGRAESMALAAEFQLGQYKAAADRAVRLYELGKSSQWRMVAVLLTVDDKPDDAVKMLAEVDRSGTIDTLVGLIVATRRGDDVAAKKWFARLQGIDKQLSSGSSGRGVPPEYMFLAALAVGDVAKAREVQAIFGDGGAVMQSMAAELISSASRAGSASEAAGLLKASLSMERGLAAQGRAWAMSVLKARPTCQWAAGIVFMRAGDETDYSNVVRTLKPDGCLVAEMMQAAIHMRGREYDQAARIFARLVAGDEGNTEFIMGHGRALEMARKYPEAIELYRKAWLAKKNPIAANDAAYLITQAYPKDKARLTEAKELIQAALKAAPEAVVLLDTAGWVAHLLGDHDAATGYLRRAVKGLPNSPEVHYHLGAAEAAAGRNEMAVWHLSATVQLGDTMKARDQVIPPEMAEAIEQARAALKRLQSE